MLRQACWKATGCLYSGHDPHDLVCAAVTYYLVDELTPNLLPSSCVWQDEGTDYGALGVDSAFAPLGSKNSRTAS